MICSESKVVVDLSDLVREFDVWLRNDPDFSIHTTPPVVNGQKSWRGKAWLGFDGREVEFPVVYELNPGLNELDRIAKEEGRAVMLVTVAASDRVLDFCKERGISVMDLNGRVWIRDDGLWVERGALPGRSYRYVNEPRNVFVGKSLRIVRAILANPERPWTQTELSDCTGASIGLVSRIVKYLLGMSYLEKESWKSLRLVDPDGLLEEWGKADNFGRRNSSYSFTGLLETPVDMARVIRDWAEGEGVRIAFTQWVGAWLRHPYAEPVICSAYADRLPSVDSIEKLGIREVTSGGNLWLHVPKDEGVFIETQDKDGLPLVADPQIYVDLQGTGLRGPDAAKDLREWEGFCRHEV